MKPARRLCLIDRGDYAAQIGDYRTAADYAADTLADFEAIRVCAKPEGHAGPHAWRRPDRLPMELKTCSQPG